MSYRFFCNLFRLLFRLFYKWEKQGVENVPAKGPVVICCNHINNLDPPLLGASLERQVHFMAKEELFKIPVIGSLVHSFGSFPVSRGSADKRALKKALELLGEGRVLGVFPEGTRSKTGQLGQAHTGAAFIALKGEAVLVPAAVLGSYRLFRRVRIIFGKPIDLSEYQKGRLTSDTIRGLTDRTMEEIAALIAGAEMR
ncbi:lysophospholipid acyltransferase family protein [Salinithrix halophila]|uniref:1-acyl-sn-glycerol-3-phosphate acyltransferase n=1 Tax=Salinithrix halophila TaxID=1485204 RepID=A0ABV8JJF8_9BACL